MHKTTHQQFEIFKESVNQWLNFFGILSWEVYFGHSDKHLENRATTEAELGSRLVKFTLTKSKWPYAPTDDEIRRLAFHEVCELLLIPLTNYADERKPVGDLNDITHQVIRTLENCIYDKLDTSKINLNNNDS